MVKTTVDEEEPKMWWQSNVIEVITPFQEVLRAMNMDENQMCDILSSVLVNTSSSSQLGTMYNMLEVPEGKNAYRSNKLRTKIKKYWGM